MNKEFQWTDDLVREFATLVKITGTKEWVDPQMIAFKASHTTEVDKLDWEIVSWKTLDGTIVPHCTNGMACELHHIAALNRAWEINSIRRLRDNEVFSLGDKIDMDECGAKPIDAFYVGGKGKECGHEESDIWISTNQKKQHGVLLNYASKPLQRTPLPLFKTEDGVDVFMGDMVWFVRKDFYLDEWAINEKDKTPDKSLKYFSTEEKAKEYLILNKPSLSITEVLSISSWYGNNSVYSFHIDKLKELAKTKL